MDDIKKVLDLVLGLVMNIVDRFVKDEDASAVIGYVKDFIDGLMAE